MQISKYENKSQLSRAIYKSLPNPNFFHSLKLLWSEAKCAIIFNLQISNQATITPGGIVYAAREEVEQFCKTNFGNIRVINNPMIPKDKTFVVSK